ncbi:MAG: hypothetical protein P4L74_01545 [Candidatus Doudnabacteria bacterium]|nr:hypothetical protein [Candidatus Doudnabacteria bacterium]
MKKFLFAVPLVVLLAAGCNSATPPASQSNNQPASESTNNPSPTPATTPTTESSDNSGSGVSMAGSDVWQATLLASDNSAKGNYMISVSGHNLYLNTSRDYSTLVGKPVNVSYTGDINNFTLGDITAQ